MQQGTQRRGRTILSLAVVRLVLCLVFSGCVMRGGAPGPLGDLTWQAEDARQIVKGWNHARETVLKGLDLPRVVGQSQCEFVQLLDNALMQDAKEAEFSRNGRLVVMMMDKGKGPVGIFDAERGAFVFYIQLEWGLVDDTRADTAGEWWWYPYQFCCGEAEVLVPIDGGAE